MQKLYKEYLSELKTMKLFYGIQESEMTAMLGCIGAYLKEYKKKSIYYYLGRKCGSSGNFAFWESGYD